MTKSVAICGTRGIPACYGGFETFAEELSVRLSREGYRVVVYGRRHFVQYQERMYKGVELRVLPAPRHKYFETPVHTLLCFLHLLFNRVDVILVCNAANSPFVWLPRLFGMPVAVNVDGIERFRGKWGLLGRLWYRLGEICSVWFANSVVADADVIKNYYLERYKKDCSVIRYGFRELEDSLLENKLTAAAPASRLHEISSIFEELKVSPDAYLLYVSRLEPENNAHLVVQAYTGLPEEVKQQFPLLVIGDAPYARAYVDYVKSLADQHVIFGGYRFGESYSALQIGAYLYVQATEVGGTHPALVEAMGFANCVVANDTPEHNEVLSNAGVFYPKNSVAGLREKLYQLVGDRNQVYELRRRARERALCLFKWDGIVNDYRALFDTLTGRM